MAQRLAYEQQTAATGATRALLEMGVFEKLPLDGKSRTATELSEPLGVDKVLLGRLMSNYLDLKIRRLNRSLAVRLMRMATVTGLFQEVDAEEYAHTPYSMVYLVPEMNSIFRLM